MVTENVWLHYHWTAIRCGLYFSKRNIGYRASDLPERFLVRSPLDVTLVYRHDEENELGQLTKLTAGGMQRSYTFNDCGLLTRRSIMRADETVMFDHSYSFNTETNSLENRTDETRGLSENFGYDELNRLRIEGHNSIIYDDLGNIRRKSNENNLGLNLDQS